MKTNGSDRPGSDRAQDHSSLAEGQDADLARLSGSMLSRLSRTIETELIPRFMLAFEPDTAARSPAEKLRLDDKIDEFVRLIIEHDSVIASEFVDALRQQGVPLAEIYLDLLGPSARRLGDMWDNDDATFTEVAVGVCRMHQVLLDFSRCFDPIDTAEAHGRCALIVPTPGEEHTFGLFLVVEFLRRAGWHCWTGSPKTVGDLLKLVHEQSFDAVGLSLSADRNIEQTAQTISDLRSKSRKAGLKIVLGGRVPNEKPELVSQLGADGTAEDGREAVRVLNELCGVNRGASARG